MNGTHVMITHLQARMARAALGWSLPDIRERTGLGVNTIGRFEQGLGVQAGTMRKLIAAYQEAGIQFAPDGRTVCAQIEETAREAA